MKYSLPNDLIYSLLTFVNGIIEKLSLNDIIFSFINKSIIFFIKLGVVKLLGMVI